MSSLQRGSPPDLSATPSPSATVRDAGVVVERDPYRGRFAPSPTGPLHFGSLIAATGSYLQARRHRGQWLVRIEDVDTPRAVPGAAKDILTTLEAFGFEWHEAVIYQSERTAAYEQAFAMLKAQGRVYPCSCTRSELQAQATLSGATTQSPTDELRYPGWCRLGPRRTVTEHAWRFRVPDEPIHFDDLAQGPQVVDLNQDIGDFVIKRRDGLFAYQLAVVVDDHAQGITEVVRGADLLGNTARQIALQVALLMPTPGYLHLPLALDAQGHKLSKSSAAPALDNRDPVPALWQTLHFLRQAPPTELRHATLTELWEWAVAQWNPHHFSTLRSQTYDA